MKRTATIMVSFLGVLVLAGCATPDQRLRAMQANNAALSKDVQDKTKLIRELSEEKSRLTAELNYSTRRGKVLEKEKAARLAEEARLRKGIREFTEQVQSSLQAYYLRTEIVDYLGSELIMRASADSQKNVLLVDLGNRVRENGTIIGGRAWVTGPTKLSFCLLRQDKAEGKYRVVTLSAEIAITQSGLQTCLFALPMAAQKGDLIGVYVVDNVTIPYDDVDTGEVASFFGSVKPNSSITIVPGKDRNKRTYSFGVVGYFDDSVTSGGTALTADLLAEKIEKETSEALIRDKGQDSKSQSVADAFE